MLYDIYGNQIPTEGGMTGKVGLADLSAEIINPVLIVDENTPILNLLDLSAVTNGRSTNGVVNIWQTEQTTSDFIPVSAGQTYVAQSWDPSGSTSYDKVELFDGDKTFLQNCTTGSNGTVRYCIFTPTVNGYARYCYNQSEDANPMVFIGQDTTDTFVPYTGETLSGEAMYEVASQFKDMVRRDVEPSNLYGKRVYIIGDSNSNNWSAGTARELEKRYGCRVIGLGQYGATWATSTDADDTATGNAIGQWNALVAEIGIDEETYQLPDDVVLLFMMGTNAGNGTFDAANEDVTTPGGAINYILKRAKYYGRGNAIGIFLPWCGENNDQLKKAADYYKIPTFDIPAMIAEDTVSAGLVRPDGTTVTQNYITDGGNHLSQWGWAAFARIAHPWIAYQI